MSKLYRSLLWTGVLAAGVAACGDDVTVTPAPPPTPTVHSVSVGPTGVTIGFPSTLQMLASVNADAGVATTVTWSVNSPATVATINATSGLLTAVGAGAVAVQACSTVVTSVCGNATITITAAPTATVTLVNVTPPNPTLTRPATGSASLQFSAAVVGANNPSQAVIWSLPGTPANASISAGGLLTITSAIAGGTINVSACSTVVGFQGVCGFAAVNIQVPTPASISISDITWVPAAGAPANCTPTGAFPVAVLQTNVQCQIEVKVNVNAGDVTLQRLDILIGGQVVQSHTFPGTVASEGENAAVSAPVDITLSVNTRQLRRPTGSSTLFVPVIPNGNQQLSANLYTSGGSIPLAATPFILVMNNGDMAMAVGNALTLVNNSSSPSFTNIAGTWFTGSQTAGTVNYVSFSTIVPSAMTFTSSVCGASNSNTINGTATTGITIDGTFNCANVEGANALTGVTFPATYPTLAGPDGTPVTSAAFFSGVGTGFLVPTGPTTSELRWNPISPIVVAPTLPSAVLVDNKAPVVTLNTPIAFNTLFDQFWINASFNMLASAVLSADGGTGVASEQAWFLAVNGGGTCAGATVDVSNTVPGTAPLVETLTDDGTPEGHRICGSAVDNIGNASGKTGPSNFFGVDIVAPSVRLAGSTAATPLMAPATFPTVSSTANTTIYSIAAPFPATAEWGLEGIDSRSGFNQNLVAGFPANETMIMFNPANNPAVAVGCGFTNPLGQALSDNWVRTSHTPPLGGPGNGTMDCGSGAPAYHTYTGNVTDRAGNVSTTITRNYAIDQYAAPILASVGPAAIFYTAGQPANFFLFGSDDLEIIDASLTLAYPGMNAIVGTLVGVTKPLSAITGCARWDATLCNILAGAAAVDPYLFGRVDLTCSAAATPYASCAVADTPAPVASENNNVDTDLDLAFEDDDKNPTGVSASVSDVASQTSGTVAAGLLTAQTNDVAQQWGAGADIITWRILSTAGTTVVAEHKASTSITATYFDFVYLARENVGATALVICSQFPQNPGTVSGTHNPLLSDNGLNRFWTYTASKPTGTAPCTAGGNWYAVGVRSGAALLTIGLP